MYCIILISWNASLTLFVFLLFTLSLYRITAEEYDLLVEQYIRNAAATNQVDENGNLIMTYKQIEYVQGLFKIVDEVIVYNDDDGSSKDAIRLTRVRYPTDELIFANGGDRTKENIPEMIFDDVEY